MPVYEENTVKCHHPFSIIHYSMAKFVIKYKVEMKEKKTRRSNNLCLSRKFGTLPLRIESHLQEGE